MTPAQQTAKEYAKDSGAIMPHREASETYKVRYSSFLAGYEAAEGAFAEYCSENGWRMRPISRTWVTDDDLQPSKTTAELYQLWQQSL